MMETMECPQYRDSIVELALDSTGPLQKSASAVLSEVKAHVAQCTPCSESLLSMQETLAMMDAWVAPELTPYFDVRMGARLREQRAASPAGWFELVSTRFKYLSNLQVRPLLAGALATCIMIGGGTLASLAPVPAAPSATITDLKIMDKNDQALEQMDRLMQPDDNDSSTSTSSSPNP